EDAIDPCCGLFQLSITGAKRGRRGNGRRRGAQLEVQTMRATGVDLDAREIERSDLRQLAPELDPRLSGLRFVALDLGDERDEGREVIAGDVDEIAGVMRRARRREELETRGATDDERERAAARDGSMRGLGPARNDAHRAPP